MDDQIIIVAAIRTAIGRIRGQFSKISATKLGGLVIIERTKVDPLQITCVIMGQVLRAGVGQNPARQATLMGKFRFAFHRIPLIWEVHQD